MAPCGCERLAPAKVNLWLHVGAARPDGYHPIDSLMVFADIGDTLRLRPGDDEALRVEGPFAPALAGGNLVDAARAALARAFPGRAKGFGLTLDKRLPVAAGLGGGSADAAAALVLIRDRLNLPATDHDLAGLAAQLGSDTPACLASRPVIARGRGEILSAPPAFPDLDAVLVNPAIAAPTGAVFHAFDQSGSALALAPPPWLRPMSGPADLIEYLRLTRNDLEEPAARLHPEIGEVLRLLGHRPETLLARMSGSGATCVALCAAPGQARRLAAAVARERPSWWVAPCVLGGTWRR